MAGWDCSLEDCSAVGQSEGNERISVRFVRTLPQEGHALRNCLTSLP